MKTYETEGLSQHIQKTDLANIFHVYEDTNLNESSSMVYNIMRTVAFDELSDIPDSFFSYYLIKEHDTWPLISYKLYNTIDLWWLLIKLNNITDPFFEPPANTRVRYVTQDEANNILTTIKTN